MPETNSKLAIDIPTEIEDAEFYNLNSEVTKEFFLPVYQTSGFGPFCWLSGTLHFDLEAALNSVRFIPDLQRLRIIRVLLPITVIHQSVQLS